MMPMMIHDSASHNAAGACSNSRNHRHHHPDSSSSSIKCCCKPPSDSRRTRRLLFKRLVWVLGTMGLLYTWQQYRAHRHLYDYQGLVMVASQSLRQQRLDEDSPLLFLVPAAVSSHGNSVGDSSNSSSTTVGSRGELGVASILNLNHQQYSSIAAATAAATAEAAPSSTESSSSSSSLPLPDWVIFYNIFIPKSSSSSTTRRSNGNDTTTDDSHHIPVDAPVENAKRIVMEQVDMIRRSFAGGAGGDAVHHQQVQQQQQQVVYQPVQVFYNTIGNPNVVTTSWMQELCTRQLSSSTSSRGNSNIMLPVLDCRFMQHYPQGAFEEVTLQKLYEHCQADNNHNTNGSGSSDSSRRVVYLHSKGSYHDHADRRNEHWRRHGTLAATSRDCIHPPSSSSPSSLLGNNNNTTSTSTCNLCGLQFWTYCKYRPQVMWNFFQMLQQPKHAQHTQNLTFLTISISIYTGVHFMPGNFCK
jgi:hypothetical protein